ncbi:hypothetical protein ACH5RR_001244 [Cinchona calisaya]|uniref:Uncharacterized protein n=1 Tax=Cinchona calisaya TaxID=153742 RepID=A0ABD3B2Z9_9GENT
MIPTIDNLVKQGDETGNPCSDIIDQTCMKGLLVPSSNNFASLKLIDDHQSSFCHPKTTMQQVQEDHVDGMQFDPSKIARPTRSRTDEFQHLKHFGKEL